MNTKQISNIEITDYQRNINISTAENQCVASKLVESYEKNADSTKQVTIPLSKQSVSTKATAETVSGTYQEELEKLKNKILDCLMWKRIASFILTIICCLSAGINFLAIILFPIWLGTAGSYMVWIVFELMFSVLVVSFSSKDCKLKAPKQIVNIKRLSIYYIVICTIMVVTIGMVLIMHGLTAMIVRIRALSFPLNRTHLKSVFALTELYFILACSLRTLVMTTLVILQRHIYAMCQKYNITEMLDFTKKHLDRI
jgi:hypothetical protein